MTKKLIAVFVLFAACAANAFAEDDGFYVGLGLSNSSSDYPGSSSPNGLGVQAGFLFNKNFSAEAQYSDFGNIAPIGSMKPTSLSVAGQGILPLNERASLFAKLGVARVATKISNSGLFGVDGTYTKTAATYGVGGRIHFTPALGLRVGVDRYSTGGSQNGMTLNNGTLTVISIGAEYQN